MADILVELENLRDAVTPGPWEWGWKSGDERTDGSDWGAEGLWSDGNLILGSDDSWESEYKAPESDADKGLVSLAHTMLECTLALKEAQIALAFTIHAAGADLALANKTIVTEKVQAAELQAQRALYALENELRVLVFRT